MEIEGDRLNHSTKTNNMVQPSLQEMSQKENKLNPFPNQLKVGDRVLLDATDPHIVATTSNEEIPLTVLSIFPFSTVRYHVVFMRKENRRTYFEEEEGSVIFHGSNHKNLSPSPAVPPRASRRAFRNTSGLILITGRCIDWATIDQVQLADAIRALLTTDPWELFFGIIEPYIPRAHNGTMLNFHLGGLVRQLSVPKFGVALGLYTEQFKEENELHALTHHIHFSPSKCWHTLAPGAASHNPSRSKALVLPPSLRYLLQTIMTNYDNPGMVQFHLGGLVRQLSVPKFGVALGLYTEQFKEENELHALTHHIHFSPSKCWHTLAPGAASHNPSRSKALVLPPSLRYLYAILAHTITRRLISIAAQESSLTLIGQMSPQGISSVLSMRMIDRR
ncbi:hypothetical protein GOBAR_AA24303 [Gossypium barbadense]|uniref:Uncharacterized protein n=1 Tax=Gossypium barbadense TaxID=3634 RepID=A0A2P5WZ44_GOSBA|nr:hypothetical protein GOBAR_AA24303 [Gossypium barbadense]